MVFKNTVPSEPKYENTLAPEADAGVGAASGRALPLGSVLEDYEIQRVLSESSFAVVYLAKDRVSDRLVAIKEYQPSTLVQHSESSRAQVRGLAHAAAFKRGKHAFMSESRLLASCNHPNLLRVNRLWDANATVYRAMPYYVGKTLLQTRQASSVAPDETYLRKLVQGLVGALSALHDLDNIHGCVSPDNILMLADDQPLLMDCGAVRSSIVSPETQRLIATIEPCFLAPEQVDPKPPGRVSGRWSDIYSVAAVLYFCIAGEFPKATKREPIARVVRRLQQRQPDLKYSPLLLTLIETALADNPQLRPSSATALLRLLDPSAKYTTGISSQAALPTLNTVADASAALASSGAAPDPSLLRKFPSIDEMMVEAEQRFVTQMRVEKAKPPLSSAGSASLVLSKAMARKPMVLLASVAVIASLTWGVWILREKQQTDQLITAAVSGLVVDKPPPSDAGVTRADILDWRSVGADVDDPNPSPPTVRNGPASPLASGSGLAPFGLKEAIVVPAPAAGPIRQRPSEDVPTKALKDVSTPVDACGGRVDFALYHCMQSQCEKNRWSKHVQCQRLRDTGEVIP